MTEVAQNWSPGEIADAIVRVGTPFFWLAALFILCWGVAKGIAAWRRKT